VEGNHQETCVLLATLTTQKKTESIQLADAAQRRVDALRIRGKRLLGRYGAV
jgi:hypothetical protein